MADNCVASDHHPCEWRLDAPGRYSREQDAREKLVLRQVYGIPGKINYYMMFAVQLRYSLSDADAESRARQAWIALRCAQPSIAATARGSRMEYSIIQPESSDVWVSNTFSVHRTENSALSLSRKIQPNSDVRLHFLPCTKELLLCASHEHADAHGMLMLLNTLCEYMAFPSAPKFDTQSDRLSRPLEVAADIGKASPRIKRWTAQMLQEWKARSAHLLCISADRSGPGVGEVGTIRLTLTTKESLDVFTSAKTSNVSVNDLMTGATVMTAKMLAGNVHGNWLGGVTFDARSNCMTDSSSQQHAATIYFVACPAYVCNPSSLLDAARQIQEQRQHFQSDPEALHISQPMLDLVNASGANVQQQQPQPVARSQVEYSGLGKLDSWLQPCHGTIEIVDFWLSLGHLTTAIGVYCYTYCGRLCFTLSYNPGFHSEESMNQFIEVLRITIANHLAGGF
ncbi:cytochrome p450 [Colletotrichum chrysophilum]|uniref:Cytochrome p450 n=1 Tax=Colletotrichum chrysophilum TaxID=1836956 RepID=A0AAD9APJ0_9PEZI|nr:cytochrome p450 [Colletotrichum chrysophilum]